MRVVGKHSGGGNLEDLHVGLKAVLKCILIG
jgi:hypothetical protein